MMGSFRFFNPGRIPPYLNPENELEVLKERILQSFRLVVVPGPRRLHVYFDRTGLPAR